MIGQQDRGQAQDLPLRWLAKSLEYLYSLCVYLATECISVPANFEM